MRSVRIQTIILVTGLLTGTIGATPVNYTVTHHDPYDDVIFLTVDLHAGLLSGEVHGRPHMDIKTAHTRLENATLLFILVVYGEIRERPYLRYEFQGFYNGNATLFGIFDFMISHSNASTYLTYTEAERLDLTNSTQVTGGTLLITCPLSYFPNATTFDYLAQCVEYDPVANLSYFDSTVDTAPLAHPMAVDYLPYFGLAVLGLLGFVLVFYGKKRRWLALVSKKARCPSCGAVLDPRLEFCVACGEKITGDRTEPG